MSIRSKISAIIKSFEKPFQPLNIIEINQEKLLGNYDLVQKLNPDREIWPVLKSNAYGHGLQIVAKIMQQRQFKYIVVDSYYEALQIWDIDSPMNTI